jgi:dipeptidyl aminopeptidase/acylaminoacyl peptidase
MKRWIVLAAAAAAGIASAPLLAQETPLIPRATLFGNPDKAQGRVSPDGKWISFLAPVNGVLNVWVAPADKPEQAKVVTDDKSRGIRQYFWAYTSKHLLFLQDQGGDENWKVFVVDLKPGADGSFAARDLTPFEDIPGPDGKPLDGPDGKRLRPTAQVSGVSDKFPEEILISLNNRSPQFHDVYRVNIVTGEMKLIQQNDQYAGFIADDDYNIRLATAFNAAGGTDFFKRNDKGEFEPYEQVGMEDSLTTGPAGFDKSGNLLYMTDSRGRDTGALFARDFATGKTTLVAEDPRADVGGTIADPKTGLVQAVSFNYDREHWQVLDKAIQPDLDYLKTVADGELAVTSRTTDDKVWTVAYIVDDGPARTYLYDRSAKKAKFLFTNRKSLEGLPLAKMHAPVIKSRDGLNLVSYLTLPVSSDTDNNMRPDRPLPLVLFVHGGPWARDAWGYNPYHQWLANRGYAVLSVNYRGSTGFGKKFLNAGNMEWAGKMHDDLLDAVDWAVSQKIADKDRVAIMGGSYGGYATLVGLTFTPDTFACGVDIVGPSSIVTLLNTIPPYWAPAIEIFTKRVGDHRTEEGRKFLDSRSPLNFVNKIKKPLLIGQGANDQRVKQSEADQVVSALQTHNIPVTYVLYPDEGHGFQRPENNTSFNAVTEAFLSEHLGGRFEPIGEDFKGSTIQVPAGAGDVPGLGEALGGSAR